MVTNIVFHPCRRIYAVKKDEASWLRSKKLHEPTTNGTSCCGWQISFKISETEKLSNFKPAVPPLQQTRSFFSLLARPTQSTVSTYRTVIIVAKWKSSIDATEQHPAKN